MSDDRIRELMQEAHRGEAIPPFALPVRPTGGRSPLWWIPPAAAISAVAVVALVAVHRPTPRPMAVDITRWRAPTDFLLDTPGIEVLRDTPTISIDLHEAGKGWVP
jgi:hypothetical protein